jgi:hypothetical protein
MCGAIPPLPLYIFMAWCLAKHRDNFIFTTASTKLQYCQSSNSFNIILEPTPKSPSFHISRLTHFSFPNAWRDESKNKKLFSQDTRLNRSTRANISNIKLCLTKSHAMNKLN